jgi:hypothetical protein
MLAILINALLSAAAGYMAADAAVTTGTGKHIHEHLFQWWCEMRDYLAHWLHEHETLGIARVGIAVLDRFDEIAVRTKQLADTITLLAFAVDKEEQGYDIQTCEVSEEEAYKLFPGLKDNPVLIQEIG